MKVSQMSKIYGLMLASGETVHQIGRHGIGKSEGVLGFCKEHGNIHMELLMLSQNEVADLIGMPYEENGVTYWSKPVWLKRMEDASAAGMECVLHLDELARAPLEVRQAALQIVLDRRIHEHHLPVSKANLKTLIIASDNPSDLYQTDELDAALLDRFCSFELEVDANGWLKWANNNNVLSVITDYISDIPTNLHFMNEEDDKDKGATPRAWAKLSDVLKNIDMVPSNLAFSIIQGKLGTTVGSNFFQYWKDYVKVIKPEDLIKMIGTSDITSESGQEKVAKKIAKVTKDMEQVSADQLAQKFRMGFESGKEGYTYDVLSTYLASLNLEIMASIIKNWKEDSDTSKFYFNWAKSVPNRYIFTKITKKFK